jgi:hypothetical protein
MASDRVLYRFSLVGLALCGVSLVLLALTSPLDHPIWVGVPRHVPNVTLLAWAFSGLLGVIAYLGRGRLSNIAKWSVLIAALVVASFPTRWLLVAVVGLGEWLPPLGSYLWGYLVYPVIAELIIGIMVALLGALAVSRSPAR